MIIWKLKKKNYKIRVNIKLDISSIILKNSCKIKCSFQQGSSLFVHCHLTITTIKENALQ